MAKRCVWEFEEWNWIYHNKKLVFLIKSSLYDYSDEFILVTVDIAVAGDNGTNLAFENVHQFLHVRQKLIMCLLMKQIIFILQCQCTIWLNIVMIIQIHQEVYASLKEVNVDLTVDYSIT